MFRIDTVIFYFPSSFHLELVESTDAEPKDMEGDCTVTLQGH